MCEQVLSYCTCKGKTNRVTVPVIKNRCILGPLGLHHNLCLVLSMMYYFIFCVFSGGIFLAGVAGVSILGGFGMTLAMAKRRDPNMFTRVGYLL